MIGKSACVVISTAIRQVGMEKESVAVGAIPSEDFEHVISSPDILQCHAMLSLKEACNPLQVRHRLYSTNQKLSS